MEKKFDRRFDNIPPELWSIISRLDETKGRWSAGARLNPQVLGRLKKSVLITSSGASTRIEGSHLSDEAVEKLMRGISLQKFADRDQQEVRGYYELLSNVFESWERPSFSEGLVKHFHQELLKYVDKDKLHRGAYKKGENKVHMVDTEGRSTGILFDTTPAFLTPKEMQELVEWTRAAFEEKKYHSLLVTGNFIVEFLKIHPFTDGNGRLSRILTNLLLLQAGYLYMPYVSHEKIVEERKTDYYLALRKSQKTIGTDGEDILPWLAFFFNVLLTQSQAAMSMMTGETVEQILSAKQLSVWQFLQGVEEAAPGEISEKTSVARPTVVQALSKLLKLGAIERLGQGRASRYRVLK